MADTYQNYVVLLSSLTGSNNSTLLRDDVVNVFTFNGNAVISTSVYYSTLNSSLYLDGSGDYITVISGGNLSIPGDFTIECFVYPTTITGNHGIIQINSLNIVQNANVFGFYDGSLRCSSAVITANNWYHLALVRSGSTVYLYTNGTRSANSYTYSTAVAESRTNNWIGYHSQGYFQGYINAIRVTRNYCRYSGVSITPPTVPYEYGTRNFYVLDNPFDTMAFTYTNYTPNENFDIIIEDDPIVSLDFYHETSTNGITITGKVLGGTYNPYPVPVKRRVNLYTKDRRLINYVWSNEITGEYAFYNLKDDEYIVEAIDHTGVYDVVSHSSLKQTSILTQRLDLVFSNHSSIGYTAINEGTGRIHGRITDANNSPLTRIVYLVDERVGHSIVGMTETDLNGYYSFDDLDINADEAYTLIMIEDRDDEHFNDIIKARITPC